MEDVEHARNSEIDSLRRHELERGSDRNGNLNSRQVREQHFYRDGNAEVLRLVTRGEIEDHGVSLVVTVNIEIKKFLKTIFTFYLQ